MKITGIVALVAILAALLGVPASAAPQGANQVNSYESPCYQRERVARGIPALSVHEGRGLIAYVRAHLHGTTPDAQLADYWAALEACDRNEPVGRWDWGSMVLVRTEYLG